MPVASPRTRLVNFRVSDEEYSALITACSRHGARSISDYARLAVLRRASSGEKQSASLHWRLSALGHQLSELESRVQQLLRRLDLAGEGNEAADGGEEERPSAVEVA